MKVNEHQAILAQKILLVPYSEHHVQIYHEWMQDEDLQKATASEPLTLPEEYAMQKSWRNDADKLTFIVCTSPSNTVTDYDTASETPRTQNENMGLVPRLKDTPELMIGDINLFLYAADEVEDDTDCGFADSKKERKTVGDELQAVVGEIEIMIARKSEQGKGLGKVVLMTFLWYVISSNNTIMEEFSKEGKHGSVLRYLRVKIDKDNARSIKLFESVGFKKVYEEPNYFGELELRWSMSAANVEDIERKLGIIPLVVDY